MKEVRAITKTSEEFVMPDYESMGLFDYLFQPFLDGKFGENGKDLLTIEYPVILGREISRRKDHIAIYLNNAGRPEWLDKIQRIKYSKELTDKQEKLKKLNSIINLKQTEYSETGMFSNIFSSISENLWKEDEEERDRLQEQLDHKVDLSAYKQLWRIENDRLYDMFTSYNKMIQY